MAANCFAWGDDAKIVHTTWLTNWPANKKSSALVTEFSTPQAANKAIDEGTIAPPLRSIHSRRNIQEGVVGNEAADEAVKEAAAQGGGAGDVQLGSVGPPARPIIRLAAAAKQAIRQRIKERWQKQWDMEKGSKPTRRLIAAL
ncbi:probable RNA-directed DNA polymerase from transposon X-element [Aspergillus terreus]|uniref:Probable RNA-directed DNA polymerase from transposon X-element n=1 Tax=Aspergillus terreus TaxID=33178 RepID=A0A5M3YQQ5_ASPTE|nr:hypothetical protein ATETN484_0002095300 [Aspergillus terreus]GFF15809.1 probable RNA-directed DNA polymerase from transposon X-element [Aspergillus terreus]